MAPSGATLILAIAVQSAGGPDPAGACAPLTAEERSAARAAFERAQPFVLGQDWPAAEERLREAVRHDPGHALAQYALGQALLGQQRPRDAAEAFARSREAFRCVLTAEPGERRRIEGERRAQAQQLRAALRQLEARLAVDHRIQWQEVNSRQPMASRGAAMEAIRQLEARIDALERAARRDDPAPPGVSYALGTALLQAGETERAAAELQAAVSGPDGDPGRGDAYNNLAVALMLLGRIDEAEAAARRAEELGVPVNPRLYDELAARRSVDQ